METLAPIHYLPQIPGFDLTHFLYHSNDLGLTNIFRYYKREAGTQETLIRDLYENSVAGKTTAVRPLLPRANQQMNW